MSDMEHIQSRQKEVKYYGMIPLEVMRSGEEAQRLGDKYDQAASSSGQVEIGLGENGKEGNLDLYR